MANKVCGCVIVPSPSGSGGGGPAPIVDPLSLDTGTTPPTSEADKVKIYATTFGNDANTASLITGREVPPVDLAQGGGLTWSVASGTVNHDPESGHFVPGGSMEFVNGPASLNGDNSSGNFVTTGDYTIELWFTMDDRPSENVNLIEVGGGTDANKISIFVAFRGGCTIQLNLGGLPLYLSSTSDLWSTMDWNHVALVRSGTQYLFFINGFLADQNTNNNSLIQADTVRLGRTAGGFNQPQQNLKIQGVRLSDIARYSADFIVPNVPWGVEVPVAIDSGGVVTPLSVNTNRGFRFSQERTQQSPAIAEDGTNFLAGQMARPFGFQGSTFRYALAQADTLANAAVAGMAFDSFPGGTSGAIYTHGIVRVGLPANVTTNPQTATFTSGARYWLSQDTPGRITETEPLGGVIAPIGVGASDNKLFFSPEAPVLVQPAVNTGWTSGHEITIDGGGTTFSVAAGTTTFVDDTTSPPTKTVVSSGPFNNITPSVIGPTSPATDLAINSSGALIQKAGARFTAQETRTLAPIGGVLHPSSGTIVQVIDDQLPSFDQVGVLRDTVIDVLGRQRIISGGLYSANGANLDVDFSASKIFAIGANARNDLTNPNELSFSAVTTAAPDNATITYTYRDNSGGSNFLNGQGEVVVDQYDDGTGTLATVGAPTNRFTVQLLFTEVVGASGPPLFAFQFGQTIYATIEDALNGRLNDPFEDVPATEGSIFRGWLIVRADATDLSDPAQARFLPPPRTT